MFIYFSDYRSEYEKLRHEKLAEHERLAKEQLEKIKQDTTMGTEVPMASFITEISTGRELTDIYLKHPGNESSDDEDGTEEQPVANGDEEKEEQNFSMFVSEHLAKQVQRSKLSNEAWGRHDIP